MDLIGVLRACLVRWWVFLPIVALTTWLCVDQYREATPQFTSTAVVVVQATDELQYIRGNQTESGLVVTTPFGSSDGPRVLAGLLARALNTTTVREQLLPAGGVALGAVRDVQADTTVVTVTVVAADPETAQESIAAVVRGSNEVAASIQRGAGVKDGQYLGAYDGGPIDPPVRDYPDRVRGAVGIGLAGLLLAVLLSVVAHSLITRRPRRADRRRTEKSRDEQRRTVAAVRAAADGEPVPIPPRAAPDRRAHAPSAGPRPPRRSRTAARSGTKVRARAHRGRGDDAGDAIELSSSDDVARAPGRGAVYRS